MTVFGPDVSQYQGKPDWGKVKASHPSMGLAWYKATEGRTFIDPSCAYNRTEIPKAGLVAGAYCFLYFSQEYVDHPNLWAGQADTFAKNTLPGHGHCLDVEAAATSGHWLGVKEWCAEYRKLFPGHPLGLYSNRSLWRNRSRMPYDPDKLFDYIWHAGYRDSAYIGTKGSLAAQWAAADNLIQNSFASMGYPDCDLYQITDHASIPGISGTCDGNVYTGSLAGYTSMITGKGQVDDSMSAADVAALKAYLDSRIDDIANAVWQYKIKRMWDGADSSASLLLNGAHFYGLHGGWPTKSPDTALVAPGAPTHALVVRQGQAGGQQSLDALDASLDAAGEAATAKILAVLGTGEGGQVSPADVRAAVDESLRDLLADVRVTAPNPE